jgi:GT2 family glycosyltransferase
MKASIIIPTYRRSLGVVTQTLNSIFSDEQGMSQVKQIIVIDQNNPALDLSQYGNPDSKVIYHRADADSLPDEIQDEKPRLIHLTGLQPSVTHAKNKGARWVNGEFIFFFDDDVTVQGGCISNYLSVFESNPEVGYLGGREILDHSVPKEGSFKRMLRVLADFKGEPEYQVNGVYVGRIKPNSFMIKNFDIETDRLVKIDGARGCNWACRAYWFAKAGGFDEHYQGTALREETDLYLRLNQIGARGFYTAQSAVIHHRQLGGCDNLSASLKSLTSKFENELYFQRKHFRNRSRIWFAIRTLPLVIQTLGESKGMGIWLWLKYGFKL